MDEDQVKDESLSWVKDYIVLPDRHAGKMVFLRRDHISKMTVNLVEQSVTISADGVDTTASNLDVPFLLKKIGDPELEQEVVLSALNEFEESEKADKASANKILKKHLLGITDPEESKSTDGSEEEFSE